MSERTAFDAALGLGQGRIELQGAVAMVLGHLQPGWEVELDAGDHVEVVQQTDLSGVELIRIKGTATVPPTPPGLSWQLAILVGGQQLAARLLWPGPARPLDDVVARVTQLVGMHVVAVRLELVSTP